MENRVPIRLIGARVYIGNENVPGLADVSLGEIAPISDTVSGAGIAGEVELPTLGHTGSMTATLTWRTITKQMLKLLGPKAQDLEIRAAQQAYDSAGGELKVEGLRIYMKAIPKNFNLGNANVSSTTDTSTDFEVIYLKITIDESTALEIDKFNYVYKADGEDYLAEVRELLGG